MSKKGDTMSKEERREKIRNGFSTAWSVFLFVVAILALLTLLGFGIRIVVWLAANVS